MDTHSQQTGRPGYLRGMPASLWIEASTRHQHTSGTTLQPTIVDVSNAPSFEDAAARELCETSTRNVLDRLDVTRRRRED